MSKIKIGFIIILGMLSFSGNPKDICFNDTSLEMMNPPIQYVICDDDGFLELNIVDIQNDILSSFDGATIEEAVLICTSTGHVIRLNNVSGTITSDIICDMPYFLSDIAVDENNDIYITNFTSIFKLDDFFCTTTPLPNLILPNTANSLSFDTQGNLYFGGGGSNAVYRYDSDQQSNAYVWHDFGVGSPSGDFVILNGKMYISWGLSSGIQLYEVTVDANFNYVSHVDLGQLLPETYGLASELGKLYGVAGDQLYRINLDTFTFTTLLTNDFTYGLWGGAAGLNEAIAYEVSSHLSNNDATNNVNPLPDLWTNTQIGAQTIYVRIENSVTGVFDIVEVNLIITNTVPDLTLPTTLTTCSDANNSGTFDLTEVETELLQNVTNPVTVSYHNSENDASSNTNPVNSNYTTTQSQETIYVRVQNVNDDCFSTSEFTILVLPTPSISTPSNSTQCGTNDIFDLTEVENELLQNNTIPVSVTYHNSLADATTGTNTVNTNYQISTGQETIFVRIESTANTACFETSQFDIILNESPIIATPSNITQCESDGNFDLTQVENELLQNNTIPVSITYYNSLANATAATNTINTSYQISPGQETIFVRVESTTNTACFEIAQFDIIRNESPLVSTPNNMTQCGTNDIFDLTEVENELLQNNTIPVSVTYHNSLADATTGTNTINTNYQISTGQETIFVRIESTANTACFETSQFDIILNESPIIATPNDITQCESDGNFDLTQVENELLQNNTIPVSITYHISLANATAGTNAINTSYQISPGQETIFVRVESTTNIACFEIAQFDIIRNESPLVSTPNNMTQCGTNDTFDLTEVENELLQNNTIPVSVTYHNSLVDATTGTNTINTNYQIPLGQETIFVRIESTANTACFETSQFDIILNESPIIATPNDITQCESDGNFDLTQVENELLQNNTIPVSISYHTSLANATTATNAINTNYEISTGQETIFVRVESTDTGCFEIAQFDIMTFESIGITTPAAINLCENESDGFFNLTQVENELLQNVTQSVTISYHDSQANADAYINPLNTNYALTSAQETIYIRVENTTTNCFETTQFVIQTFQNPIVEPFVNSPSIRLLSDCYLDTNLEGYFNLNDIYSEIITNGNTSHNLEFYLSETNAEQAINSIDPIYYAMNNTEEIFVTVTNTNGCTSITNFFINPDCYDTVVDISNIYFPQFFTPNNDLTNDTWNVEGISVAVQQTAIMYIFDRYGKLLYYYRPEQVVGWDGTYRGKQMPSSEYWYRMEIVDGPTFKGSFSLVR